MVMNPYESPRERNSSQNFDWERLSSIGLWTAAPCFVMSLIIPTFSFMPKEHPILAIVATWGFIFCLAGFFVGGIAAIVGWISSAMSPLPRGR